MDVLVLIDKLDDLVHNAKQVPLTDQVRVDKEEIYDILDQMRATASGTRSEMSPPKVAISLTPLEDRKLYCGEASR